MLDSNVELERKAAGTNTAENKFNQDGPLLEEGKCKIVENGIMADAQKASVVYLTGGSEANDLEREAKRLVAVDNNACGDCVVGGGSGRDSGLGEADVAVAIVTSELPLLTINKDLMRAVSQTSSDSGIQSLPQPQEGTSPESSTTSTPIGVTASKPQTDIQDAGIPEQSKQDLDSEVGSSIVPGKGAREVGVLVQEFVSEEAELKRCGSMSDSSMCQLTETRKSKSLSVGSMPQDSPASSNEEEGALSVEEIDVLYEESLSELDHSSSTLPSVIDINNDCNLSQIDIEIEAQATTRSTPGKPVQVSDYFIHLSRRSLTHPTPRLGLLLVHPDKVIFFKSC